MHRQMDNLKTMPPAPSIGQVEAKTNQKAKKFDIHCIRNQLPDLFPHAERPIKTCTIIPKILLQNEQRKSCRN